MKRGRMGEESGRGGSRSRTLDVSGVGSVVEGVMWSAVRRTGVDKVEECWALRVCPPPLCRPNDHAHLPRPRPGNHKPPHHCRQPPPSTPPPSQYTTSTRVLPPSYLMPSTDPLFLPPA